MKRIIVAVLALALLGLPGQPARAAAPTGDLLSVAQANNALALKLHRHWARRPGNIFFSPYSIESALAMAYAGARGATAQQMAEVLGFSLDQARLHPAMASLTRQLTEAVQGPDQKLSIANALWLQTGQRLGADFKALTAQNYGAALAEIDFQQPAAAARTINQWVAKKTQNMIPTLVTPGDLQGARLVITNAIYFQGKWRKPFKKKLTHPRPFWVTPKQSKQVPMMHNGGHFTYGEDAASQTLVLPYRAPGLELVVLLPRQRDGLAALEAGLTPADLRARLASLGRQEVVVSLPRLKMSTGYLLAEDLRALGMGDAFSAQRADFSGMTGRRDFYIGQVIHKARLELEEEGTKAAAATAVVMRATAAPVAKPPKYFTADRPFVFFIRHRPSGAILFMGRVADPEG